MARRSKFINPFFLLLGIVGAVFAVSAFVYSVMTIQFSHAVGNWAKNEPSHPLLAFFSEHGTTVLVAELVILGVLTVAAIWTDDFWATRSSRVGTAHQSASHLGTAHQNAVDLGTPRPSHPGDQSRQTIS
jgi:hypothetical protein